MEFKQAKSIIDKEFEKFDNLIFEWVNKENTGRHILSNLSGSDSDIFNYLCDNTFKKQVKTYDKIASELILSFIRIIYILLEFDGYNYEPHNDFFNITYQGQTISFSFFKEPQDCFKYDSLGDFLSDIKSSGIKQITLLDEKSIRFKTKTCSDNMIPYISLEKFFNMFFSNEIYNYFIATLEKRINDAKQKSGYKSVNMISVAYVSRKIYDEYNFFLNNLVISNEDYYKFNKNGEYSNEHFPYNLEKMDKMRLKANHAKYTAMIFGANDFSKAFITAEYQYELFQENNVKNVIDFSFVILGYLKSIELLLCNIFVSLAEKGEEINLNSDKTNLKKSGIKENTMGEYLHYYYYVDDSGTTCKWLPDDSGIFKNKILSLYVSGCRNKHMHKDMIRLMDDVKKIRTNTINLLYLLLYWGDSYDAISSFKKYDGTLYNLLHLINNIPFVTKIGFKFNDGTVKEGFKLKNYVEEYNDDGEITSGIEYYEETEAINFTSEEEYNKRIVEMPNEKKFTISMDNKPTEVWFWKDKEKKLIYSHGVFYM